MLLKSKGVMDFAEKKEGMGILDKVWVDRRCGKALLRGAEVLRPALLRCGGRKVLEILWKLGECRGSRNAEGSEIS